MAFEFLLECLRVQVLTSPERVRGCGVNPERGHLQALQNAVGWTIGGFDTRPLPEAVERKKYDRLQVLLSYRQDEGAEGALRVRNSPISRLRRYT